MCESEPQDGGKNGSAGRPMANQVIAPRPQPPVNETNRTAQRPRLVPGDAPHFTLPGMHESMLRSLFRNVREALFPEKLPPLQLTSRPVPVREIWTRGSTKRSATQSFVLHALCLVTLIVASIIGARTHSEIKPEQHVTLTVPPLSDYQPVMQPKVALKPLAGGGGGGEHAKISEPKGHL